MVLLGDKNVNTAEAIIDGHNGGYYVVGHIDYHAYISNFDTNNTMSCFYRFETKSTALKTIIDPTGALYVAGIEYSELCKTKLFLAKFDSLLSLLWLVYIEDSFVLDSFDISLALIDNTDVLVSYNCLQDFTTVNTGQYNTGTGYIFPSVSP